ncbi:MAG: M28 family peptidase, partial [Anaerolineales bacterium]
MRIVNLLIITILPSLILSCIKPIAVSPTPTIDVIQTISNDLNFQLECGGRLPNSNCHKKVEEYIVRILNQNHWKVEEQLFTRNGHKGINIIGRYGNGDQPIIIGAHYDTRLTADRDPDPDKRMQPMPGANDGASGVAVLLQLAREIPSYFNENQVAIWLVFFDLEDNGDYESWDWILGSTEFVNQLTITPKVAVVVDMVGDKDLNLYYDGNSDPTVQQSIWSVASRLGYDKIFIPKIKYYMIDDHTPFLQKGIHAVDIIDFDYPYWHT